MAGSILVVGSVAFDTVETPFGRAEKVLGGSASFFAVAANAAWKKKLVEIESPSWSYELGSRNQPPKPKIPPRTSVGP